MGDMAPKFRNAHKSRTENLHAKQISKRGGNNTTNNGRKDTAQTKNTVETLKLAPEYQVKKKTDGFSPNDTPCADVPLRTTLIQIDELLKDLEESVTISGFAPFSILTAAREGDAEGVLHLLDAGASPRQRDSQGDSALHIAAREGHDRVITALVVLGGAHVNILNRPLRTPLHCAAEGGHVGVGMRLLIAGARVDLKDSSGDTPLLLAAKTGHWDFVKLLAEKGGLSAMVRPLGRWLSTDMEANNIASKPLTFLNARDKFGNSALVYAAKAGQWDTVKLLLSKGASATAYQIPDCSPLALAVRSGETALVKDLLRAGASSGQQEVKIALDFAREAAVVYSMVQKADERGRALREAAQGGRINQLVANLAAGGDINAATNKGRTALHFASHYGHSDCVKFLLTKGALRDLKDCDGCTPLHFAAFQGREKVIEVLLCAGVDINSVDNAGCTALHWASYNGHTNCVKLLLRMGALVDLRDQEGRTPLHDAADRGWMNVIWALLVAGADVMARDNNQKTPENFARNEEVRQMLLRNSHRKAMTSISL